jgi:hypothetical protein
LAETGGTGPAWRIRRISDEKIFADPAGSLVQRGFRKSGLRKILFSKNLDTKILGTKSLAGPVSRWANRHCLDHDRAI